jgi:hypothetical protein
MKSTLFVQANVAVNTKLTLKVPFCLEISKFFKQIWSKTCNFGMVRRENFSLRPPPPQSFDASYAAVFNFVGAVRVQTMGVTGAQNFYNRHN